MLLQNPFLQARLPFVERQIPVGCLLKHRDIAGYGRAGIDKVGGIEACAASLALVAVCVLVATVWASACHIAVGKKLAGLGIVKLLRCLFHKFALVVKTTEEIGSRAAVSIGCSAPVNIKRNAEFLKRIFYNIVISVHYILWGDTLGACLDSDRHTMLVGAAYEKHIGALEPEVSDINIGRDIYAGEMSYMHRSVGVRERRGDQSSLEILIHSVSVKRVYFSIKLQNYKISAKQRVSSRKFARKRSICAIFGKSGINSYLCPIIERHRMGISVVINTYNEASNLPECLAALRGFDEILVCDMESTDNTVEIALRNGCKVVTFPKGDHKICEPARDFAIQSASQPWVLVVDADETVTPGLRDYLYNFISNPGDTGALMIPRKNYRMHRFRRSSYPDYQMRFLKKEGCHWPPVIHSHPTVIGKTEAIPANRLDLALRHKSVSLTEIMERMNRYSSADVIRKRNKKATWLKMVFEPWWFFIRVYFLEGAIRYGTAGYIAAKTDAVSRFVFLAKLYEEQHDELFRNKELNL